MNSYLRQWTLYIKCKLRSLKYSRCSINNGSCHFCYLFISAGVISNTIKSWKEADNWKNAELQHMRLLSISSFYTLSQTNLTESPTCLLSPANSLGLAHENDVANSYSVGFINQVIFWPYYLPVYSTPLCSLSKFILEGNVSYSDSVKINLISTLH